MPGSVCCLAAALQAPAPVAGNRSADEGGLGGDFATLLAELPSGNDAKQTSTGVFGFVGEFGVVSATASALVDAKAPPALADAGDAKNTDTVKNAETAKNIDAWKDARTVQGGAGDPATLGQAREGGQARVRLSTGEGVREESADLQEPGVASLAGPGGNSSEAATETAGALGATGPQVGAFAEPGAATAPVESDKVEQGAGGASTNGTETQSAGAGPGGAAATARQDAPPVRRAGARREAMKDVDATAGGVADVPQVPGQGPAAVVPVAVATVAIPAGGQSLVSSAAVSSPVEPDDTSGRLDAIGGGAGGSVGNGVGVSQEGAATIFAGGSQPASTSCAAASADVSANGRTAQQTSGSQRRGLEVAGAEANVSRDPAGAQQGLITGAAGQDVPTGRVKSVVQDGIEAAGSPAGPVGTGSISAAPGATLSQAPGGGLSSTPAGVEPDATAAAGGVRTASGMTGTRTIARGAGGTEAVAGPDKLPTGEESRTATGTATSAVSSGASAVVGRVGHQAAPGEAVSGTSQAKSVDPAAQLAPALVSLGGGGASQHMTIRLDPEELGRVQIRIEQSGDSGARVTLTAERPQTLELLVRDHAQLQSALDQAGIPAEGRSVTFHLSGTAMDGGNASTAGTFGSSSGFAGEGGGGNFGARQNGPQGGQSGAQFGTEDQPEAANSAVARWLRVGIDITA